MTRYEAAKYLTDLTDFQLRSVDHVLHQFYGPPQADRFLVADETGLGKTRVARGLIAKAIERLQDDDSVRRIDVVYVCANADLAQQNITRLNVTDQEEIPFSSRLTLLAEHSRKLKRQRGAGKPVNLVSFTPGTSFDMGSSLGQARERAMIALALAQIYELDTWQRKALHVILQGGVSSPEHFRRYVDELANDIGDAGLDRAILRQYDKAIGKGGRKGIGSRLIDILDEIGRKRSVPEELRASNNTLIRDLRAALAAASVHTLEPDLVILDEFQRFRHLLDDSNPAGELAHHLFEYEAAKVLLLSATPYKPFTYVEERHEDHAKDLFRTLEFLAKGHRDVDVEDIRTRLKDYRQAVVSGLLAPGIIEDLRYLLLKLMSRAERPVLPEGAMATERLQTAADVRAGDLVGYARLRELGTLVGRERDHGLVTPEYWKSAPYFVNFCDGYQLGRRINEAAPNEEVTLALRATQHVSASSVERFQAVDPGNARMRLLAEDTVGQDWWQLLWVPPSLPYLTPAGPYANPAVQGMTKRLVFSSWTASPTAVASILSYEAERRAAAETNYSRYSAANRKRLTKHLQYKVSQGRPGNMSTLLLQWPMAEFARLADPLTVVAASGGITVDHDHARDQVRDELAMLFASQPPPEPVDEDSGRDDMRDSSWQACFSMPGNWPTLTADGEDLEIGDFTYALSGHQPDEDGEAHLDDATGLARHIELAFEALDAGPRDADAETIDVLVDVALFSPANIALRALRRLADTEDGVTEWGVFEAAVHLATGIRSLFNRPDATKVVERLAGDEHLPYWRKVLNYCAMGNLEAVLDEYLYHLVTDRRSGSIDDDFLHDVAAEVAGALQLRAAPLQAKNPRDLENDLRFVPRFALRYGGRQQSGEDARQPEVRRAFNSPFWPMVLASTSVGQEGIDFHWWCHAVFHWNTPSNPVDFEQREGRVDRYRGHAVRKNIAARHGQAALADADGNPWDRLYELATDYREEYGDFTPGWVYPGPNKIERHVAPVLLSSDTGRYERMKRDVALYRLTFGQPRQEDMLELLRRRGVDTNPELLKTFRINLAP